MDTLLTFITPEQISDSINSQYTMVHQYSELYYIMKGDLRIARIYKAPSDSGYIIDDIIFNFYIRPSERWQPTADSMFNVFKLALVKHLCELNQKLEKALS